MLSERHLALPGLRRLDAFFFTVLFPCPVDHGHEIQLSPEMRFLARSGLQKNGSRDVLSLDSSLSTTTCDLMSTSPFQGCWLLCVGRLTLLSRTVFSLPPFLKFILNDFSPFQGRFAGPRDCLRERGREDRVCF